LVLVLIKLTINVFFRWVLRQRTGGEVYNPPGFAATNITHHHVEVSRDVDPALIVKRSWDFALGPAKQVGIIMLNGN
jgi:hypothetical protein